MDCHECREKLSALHEGDLNSAEADGVREHLHQCADCAAEYEKLAAVISAVQALDVLEPPTGALERIFDALDNQHTTPGRSPIIGHLAPVLAAAASIAIVVAGIAFYRGNVMGTTHYERAAVTAPKAAESPVPASRTTGAAGEDSSPEPASEPEHRPQEDAPPVSAVTSPDEASTPERKPTDVDAQRSPPRTTDSLAQRPSTEDRVAEQPPAVSPSLRNRSVAAVEDTARETTAPRVEAETEADHAVVSCSVTGPERRPPSLSVDARRGGGGEARYFEGPPAPAKPEPSPQISKGIETKQEIEELHVGFIPPRTRQVGVRATSAIEIQSASDLPEVAVRVETRNGLQVSNSTDEYVFRGPVQADVKKTIDIPLKATDAGTQRLRITVETPPEGLHTQMEATLPGFITGPAKDRQDALGAPVSVDFTEMPIRHALLEIAREGHLNLVLDSAVGKRRVTYACDDAPAGAVLRIVAEDAGYSVRFEHDTYFIAPGTN